MEKEKLMIKHFIDEKPNVLSIKRSSLNVQINVTPSRKLKSNVYEMKIDMNYSDKLYKKNDEDSNKINHLLVKKLSFSTSKNDNSLKILNGIGYGNGNGNGINNCNKESLNTMNINFSNRKKRRQSTQLLRLNSNLSNHMTNESNKLIVSSKPTKEEMQFKPKKNITKNNNKSKNIFLDLVANSLKNYAQKTNQKLDINEIENILINELSKSTDCHKKSDKGDTKLDLISIKTEPLPNVSINNKDNKTNLQLENSKVDVESVDQSKRKKFKFSFLNKFKKDNTEEKETNDKNNDVNGKNNLEKSSIKKKNSKTNGKSIFSFSSIISSIIDNLDEKNDSTNEKRNFQKIVSCLKQIPNFTKFIFLNNLTDSHLYLLAKYCTLKKLAENEVIFKYNERPSFFSIIIKGNVVEKNLIENRRKGLNIDKNIVEDVSKYSKSHDKFFLCVTEAKIKNIVENQNMYSNKNSDSTRGKSISEMFKEFKYSEKHDFNMKICKKWKTNKHIPVVNDDNLIPKISSENLLKIKTNNDISDINNNNKFNEINPRQRRKSSKRIISYNKSTKIMPNLSNMNQKINGKLKVKKIRFNLNTENLEAENEYEKSKTSSSETNDLVNTKDICHTNDLVNNKTEILRKTRKSTKMLPNLSDSYVNLIILDKEKSHLLKTKKEFYKGDIVVWEEFLLLKKLQNYIISREDNTYLACLDMEAFDLILSKQLFKMLNERKDFVKKSIFKGQNIDNNKMRRIFEAVSTETLFYNQYFYREYDIETNLIYIVYQGRICLEKRFDKNNHDTFLNPCSDDKNFIVHNLLYLEKGQVVGMEAFNGKNLNRREFSLKSNSYMTSVIKIDLNLLSSANVELIKDSLKVNIKLIQDSQMRFYSNYYEKLNHLRINYRYPIKTLSVNEEINKNINEALISKESNITMNNSFKLNNITASNIDVEKIKYKFKKEKLYESPKNLNTFDKMMNYMRSYGKMLMKSPSLKKKFTISVYKKDQTNEEDGNFTKRKKSNLKSTNDFILEEVNKTSEFKLELKKCIKVNDGKIKDSELISIKNENSKSKKKIETNNENITMYSNPFVIKYRSALSNSGLSKTNEKLFLNKDNNIIYKKEPIKIIDNNDNKFDFVDKIKNNIPFNVNTPDKKQIKVHFHSKSSINAEMKNNICINKQESNSLMKNKKNTPLNKEIDIDKQVSNSNKNLITPNSNYSNNTLTKKFNTIKSESISFNNAKPKLGKLFQIKSYLKSVENSESTENNTEVNLETIASLSQFDIQKSKHNSINSISTISSIKNNLVNKEEKVKFCIENFKNHKVKYKSGSFYLPLLNEIMK